MVNDGAADEGQVWLNRDEYATLLDAMDGTQQKIAARLGGDCGMRVSEVTSVNPNHLVTGPAGEMVRIYRSKDDVTRETPLPEGLKAMLNAYAEVRGADADTPFVDVTTRTVRKWVEAARERRYAATGDEGWLRVTPHDLRRSWAQALLESDVEPMIVMEWGGWRNWRTFREHYLDIQSPRMQKQEREKAGFI